MKTMKRVISTALLLCMLAALMSVSAFALAGDAVELTASQYEVTEGSGEIVNFSAKLISSDLSQLDNMPAVWYKNGVQVKEETTMGGGFSSASFGEGAFNVGANIIKVQITTFDNTVVTKEVTVVKHEAPQAMVVTLDKTYASVDEGSTVDLLATVNGVQDNTQVSWQSSNPNVASVFEGTVTGVAPGQATIIVADLNNGVEYARCVVTVNAVDPGTVVTISPIVYQLQKNQSINIRASVSGTGRFDHWYVADNMGSYVTINNTNAANTTLTARAATNVPVRLYAYSDDGASAYIEFTIVAAESLKLEANPSSINNGQVSTVYVVNPMGGEEFTWSITPSASYGVLARSNNLGSAVELTAGALEGRVVVTATSKADSTRAASVTVYVNSEASYGSAQIIPSVATWSSGKLTFEVYPAYYKAYLDGKLLTANSGYYTYYGNILTLNPSLLATLTNGEHTLKVYTASGNGMDGLVYATIYVNKAATASSVYGDNTHVRGSSYNLYFTSTDPITDVYISNQWIDPANYSLDSTGRYLTLNANFLNQLGYGSYTMKLATQNGYTETATFRIVTANYAPPTGDDSNIGAWMLLLTVSCAGALALIPKRKKSTDLM